MLLYSNRLAESCLANKQITHQQNKHDTALVYHRRARVHPRLVAPHHYQRFQNILPK